MTPSEDSVGRPGTGPLPSPEANDAFAAVKHEHRVTNKPPVAREVVEVPSVRAGSANAATSAPNTSVPAPAVISLPQMAVIAPSAAASESVTAEDVQLASARYVSSLAALQKATDRVMTARAELEAALVAKAVAEEAKKAAQQDLLIYLQ